MNLFTIFRYSSLTLSILAAVPQLQALFSGGRRPTGAELSEAIGPVAQSISAAFPTVTLDPSLVLADCNAVALTYDRAASGKDAAQVAYEAYQSAYSSQFSYPVTKWEALPQRSKDGYQAIAKALVG